MKLKLSRKNAILVLIIFVVIFTSIFIILLTSKLKKHYPEQPIPIKNVGTTQKELDISQSEINSEINEVYVYAIEPKVHISLVESMIENMGLNLQREDKVKDSYVVWGDGKNQFTYEAVTDTVTFQLTSSTSIKKGNNAFTQIFKQYFNTDYEFEIKEESTFEGNVSVFASRLINNVPIEYGSDDAYSDILRFDQSGNLNAGQLLLVEIEEYNLTLPLITQEEIQKYVNLDTYPKDIHVDTSVLMSTLEIDYLDDAWLDIESSVTDCKADSADLILLYKNSNQQYLLPAYKYYSNCKVEYDNKEYTVPSIFYLSASDPRFVTID